MDKKTIKKALIGLTVASLIAGTAILSGCGSKSSCGKGSCGDKMQDQTTENSTYSN